MKNNKQRLFEIMSRVDPSFNPNNEQDIIDDILSLNEGISDIMDKLINYGKKGLLTASIVLAVAFSSIAQQQSKSNEIIRVGNELLQTNEKQMVYAFMVAIATESTTLSMENNKINDAGAFKEIALHYENLRDGKTTQPLSENAMSYLKNMVNIYKNLDKDTVDYFIKLGMNIHHK